MFKRMKRFGVVMGATAGVVLAAGAVATVAHASAGAAAAPAVNLFARVSGGGTLLTGGGVTGVTRLGTGRYEVTFGANVRRCAYVATTVNAHSQALQVFTAGGHFSADGVYVETKNQGGGLTDGPFNLAVDCGRPGWYYAVVGYRGNLVRSSPGVALGRPGTGRYEVTFPQPVGSCAFVATVGDPGSGLVFHPAGVYTGSGTGPRTVYVETKNQGGGLSSGIPFHLGVICKQAPGTRIAVVAAIGLTNRGSALTSSFTPALGQYAVITNEPAGRCAAVATRGSVDRAVPFDPATVEVTQGPAFNTFGVQVRGLLFFGGRFADEAFHAALAC